MAKELQKCTWCKERVQASEYDEFCDLCGDEVIFSEEMGNLNPAVKPPSHPQNQKMEDYVLNMKEVTRREARLIARCLTGNRQEE